MERIDVLGKRPERAGAFRGALLSDRLDDELQRIVKTAAERLHCPTGLVTLVLDRVQFFRAHYGLTGELRTALATDRTLSFCQYVVRDQAMVEINDAGTDHRVPTAALARFGSGAYLGAPIRAGGEVVGSLCVLDGVPRNFSSDDRTALGALAEEATLRLDVLAAGQAGREERLRAHSFAAAPAFSELRNVLGALAWDISHARVAAAEIAPLCRMVREECAPDLAFLRESARAADDLATLLAAVETAADRVKRQVLALEAASMGQDEAVSLEALIPQAAQLAHHHLKLVGGVRWPSRLPDAVVTVSRPTAVSALGALFSAGAQACFKLPGGGFDLAAELQPASVRLWLSGPALGPDQAKACADSLRILLAGELGVGVLEEEGRVGLAFPR